MEHGLIHRLASLNAYIGCATPGKPHIPQFFVCQSCGNAVALRDPAIEHSIASTADQLGFQISESVIEILGICPFCQSESQIETS